MSEMNAEQHDELFKIVDAMNDHGAVVLQRADADAAATFHVVEYADESMREHLSTLHAGERVRLELRRAGRRANVWSADRVLPGTVPTETVSA